VPKISDELVLDQLSKRVGHGYRFPRSAAASASVSAADSTGHGQFLHIKQRLGKNSIKLYDKAYGEQGAVLRAELTLNAAGQFWVFRHKTGQTEGQPQWLPLRAGIAGLHRRTEVSQKALDRYYTALAQVDDTTTLGELVAQLEQRVRWNRYWVRALHPFEPGDLALLRAVNRGEFVIHSMRNRDLQTLLYSSAPSAKSEVRRRSAAISRKLRMLRAHGNIQKLPHKHRYQVRPKAASHSTPFSRLNALRLSSLRLWPHKSSRDEKKTEV
jgi:hypothetical protein